MQKFSEVAAVLVIDIVNVIASLFMPRFSELTYHLSLIITLDLTVKPHHIYMTTLPQ